MELWHVTHKGNLPAIEKEGIRPDLSRGKRMLSWYVTRDMVAWAFLHAAKRHGWEVQDLVAVQSFPPRWRVSKHPSGNLFYTKWNFFGSIDFTVLTFDEVADSLAKGE